MKTPNDRIKKRFSCNNKKNCKTCPGFKKRWGFEFMELYNLNTWFYRTMRLRLKAFSKHQMGWPAGMTIEEWDTILYKIRKAFIYADRYQYRYDEWKIHKKEIDIGMKLFIKYIGTMWI